MLTIHRALQPANRGLGAITRIGFGLVIVTVLATAILTRPAKWLTDFDQAFYLSIAYDLDHHGTFSNGIFDDATGPAPRPGMFFAPLFPLLVLAATKLDPRFAAAVDCAIEAQRKVQDGSQCEAYARPVLLVNAAFLAIGVIAIGWTAELIFAAPLRFWVTAALATVAILLEANLFSFAMTESVTFGLYGIAGLLLVRALQVPRASTFMLAGCVFGLLCLTRISFTVLAPVLPGLIALGAVGRSRRSRRAILLECTTFAAGWLLIVAPWLVRNGVSVGKWGLTEEYGSAALIERFAFNDMTLREYLLAFPYCLPGIGAPLVEGAFGAHAMDRFSYDTPLSFFQAGRNNREELVAIYGHLDPVIAQLAQDELRTHWGRYLLASVPLGWCGMWVGGVLSLLLVPLFVVATISAFRRRQALFLVYAIPPWLMLGLHAAVANHYTRYNIILLAPFCVGAGWVMTHLRMRRPLWRSPMAG